MFINTQHTSILLLVTPSNWQSMTCRIVIMHTNAVYLTEVVVISSQQNMAYCDKAARIYTPAHCSHTCLHISSHMSSHTWTGNTHTIK